MPHPGAAASPCLSPPPAAPTAATPSAASLAQTGPQSERSGRNCLKKNMRKTSELEFLIVIVLILYDI